ncbi:DUF4136 domain-containing protein [Ramlibacter sp. PS3R-8]|uniref:DUF4136 domain-containing protein n=1 Tax=Ramlibacter sp. PS3R-8 TaxID=3133437 RepID=UPI0030A41342
MTRLLRRHLLGSSLAAMLAACAAPPPPQATVQVFAAVAQLPPEATYRHERLPSQAGRPDQSATEAAADTALARAGLRRDDANPRLAVEVAVSQHAVGYGPAWGIPSWVNVGVGGGSWGGGGVGIGLSFPVGGTPAYPSQRVDVLLRDLASGQVLFQSQATSNSGASAASLVEASLRNFPNAQPGTWVVPL